MLKATTSAILRAERCYVSSSKVVLTQCKRTLTTEVPSRASRPTALETPSQQIRGFEREQASKILHGRAVLPPVFHPQTNGVPVALLQLRSYHPELLGLFSHFATHAAAALALPVSRPAPLPTKRSLWTVPKGPFVHKKSQENFERKVYGRVIKAWDGDESVVQRWINYLGMYPCPGVGMRFVRWVRAPVGVGRAVSEEMLVGSGKDGISKTDRAQMEDVARRIIKEEMEAAGLKSKKEIRQ
ncbi:ribosomal protein S10 [Schizopora paradoxa]|uniref:Ribosomal protein S10 n=1 Tax=Schizopora paradoxa TaxID=27342 RepID=A0A0H2RXI7_9AGAM|nr:ribosomal protein S10 [Schizopora paradoxa]